MISSPVSAKRRSDCLAARRAKTHGCGCLRLKSFVFVTYRFSPGDASSFFFKCGSFATMKAQISADMLSSTRRERVVAAMVLRAVYRADSEMAVGAVFWRVASPLADEGYSGF
jgi:hypothetical protein